MTDRVTVAAQSTGKMDDKSVIALMIPLKSNPNPNPNAAISRYRSLAQLYICEYPMPVAMRDLIFINH